MSQLCQDTEGCAKVFEQMRSRLVVLKREYELGDAQLRELVQREAVLRETLLRISGAVQVLEEILASDLLLPDGVASGKQAVDAATLSVP
jgi:hypothetical protein